MARVYLSHAIGQVIELLQQCLDHNARRVIQGVGFRDLSGPQDVVLANGARLM